MRFTKKQITKLFEELGLRLLDKGIIGEIGIMGGAAMVLAYEAREATRDVDAIFKPSKIILDITKKMAVEHDIPPDWLNDGVKGFLPGDRKKRLIILDFPGLKVWTPEPEYMLAMKAMSARVDTKDADDIKFLIKKLKIKTARKVFSIVEKYYPNKVISVKTQYEGNKITS